MIDQTQLIKELKEQGITISKDQADMMDRFVMLLIEWNRKINLTSILEPDQIVTKHLVDSLLLVPLIPNDSKKMIDIGAGGGFPSVPISILYPELEVVQADSLQKRVRFLEEVKERLSLSTRPIAIRAEEAGKREEFREQFDVVIARAVANLAVLLEYALPLTQVGGRFIPLKGPAGLEELSASRGVIRELGGEIEQVKECILEDGSKRILPIIKKISHTPTKYPRNTARITKKPLFFPE